jgi:LmbE family N-acetylglucosaminyl deacetylase
MFCLGGIDQEAVFEIQELTGRLLKLLLNQPPAVVIAHPYEGGHPDHDAAALVACSAISSLRENQRPVLLEMTSYHARDGQCVTGKFLNPDATQALSIELSENDRERKRRMMDAYESQRLVLEAFPTDRELLRLAPQYDFSLPPHAGKLWYECMNWMTGARWRELANSAVPQLQEQSCR